jgi:acyl dehydratase
MIDPKEEIRPMSTTVALSELPALAGQTLGTSDWVPVTQEMIDRFAAATGDDQWIHVDPARAARGPLARRSRMATPRSR